jgi:hypothetical protein
MMSSFFNTRQKWLKEIERRQDRQRLEIERNVCALISRGNISLQRGEFITKEDLDRAQSALEAFFLSDKSKW